MLWRIEPASEFLVVIPVAEDSLDVVLRAGGADGGKGLTIERIDDGHREIARHQVDGDEVVLQGDVVGYDVGDCIVDKVVQEAEIGDAAVFDEERGQRALIDEFIRQQPFEVPGSMVERVIESKIERAGREAQGREYDENDFRQSMRADAVRAVQTWLIVDAVIAAQKIEVKREDVDERIAELVEVSDTEPKQLKRRLIKEGQLDDLKHDIAQRRAYEWMTEVAEVTEETMQDTPGESRIVKP